MSNKEEDLHTEEILFDESSEQDADLFEHFRFTVDPGQQPLRIDKFLMNHRQNATRNKISNACRAGNVWVNGIPVKQNYRVKPHDEIAVLLARPPRSQVIVPQEIPLDIIFEDDDVLVINKPPGLVVHPGHGNWDGTLINGIAYHYEKQNLTSDLERIGLVHRIDKDTSGLLVLAKNEYSLSFLAKQFFEKTTKREYKALVWGRMDAAEGSIEGYLARNPGNRLQMKLYKEEETPEAVEFGKYSLTHWKLLEDLRFFSFISCRLETGRTHQIRAHFKSLGQPIFNDERYGGDEIIKGENLPKYKTFVENLKKNLPRQALHAESLGFQHPTTMEQMHFEVALPDDISKTLDKIRNYLNGNISS